MNVLISKINSFGCLQIRIIEIYRDFYTAKQLSHIPTKLRANTNLIYIGYYDDALEKDRIKKTLGKESYEQYYTKLDPKKHEFIELDTVARTIRIVSV